MNFIGSWLVFGIIPGVPCWFDRSQGNLRDVKLETDLIDERCLDLTCNE